MKSLQLILAGLGIKIQPEEIEKAFNDGKNLIPQIAADFKAIKEAQEKMAQDLADMKAKLEMLVRETSEPVAKIDDELLESLTCGNLKN